jgi:hypothetical protein
MKTSEMTMDLSATIVSTTVLSTVGAWAPAVAIAIAVTALVGSTVNRRIAKRGLALAQELERRAKELANAQEDARIARLEFTVGATSSWRDDDPAAATRWVGVRVLASNPSDRLGSVMQAALLAQYSVDGHPMLVRTPHQPTNTPLRDGGRSLSLPAPLNAKGEIDGWLTFPLSDALTTNPIDWFKVVVSDDNGPVTTIDVWTPVDV